MRGAGVEGPQACPRGLRHSFGVAAVTAGVPLPTIATVLGQPGAPAPKFRPGWKLRSVCVYEARLAWCDSRPINQLPARKKGPWAPGQGRATTSSLPQRDKFPPPPPPAP